MGAKALDSSPDKTLALQLLAVNFNFAPPSNIECKWLGEKEGRVKPLLATLPGETPTKSPPSMLLCIGYSEQLLHEIVITQPPAKGLDRCILQ